MKRTLSGIVILIVAVILIFPGGYVTWAGAVLLSLMAMFELYRVFGIEKKLLGIVGYLTAIFYYITILPIPGFSLPAGLWVGVTVLAVFSVYVIRYTDYKLQQFLGAILAPFYIAFMMSHLYLIRMMDHGLWLIWVPVVAACGCDIFAYVIGSKFGKHKMAPVLSPKKSKEGSVGGVVAATILGVIYGAVLDYFIADYSGMIWKCALICLAGSIICEIGDLAASAIKRQMDVKDYGNLIPGHGGILDRFDSLLFTGVTVYYILLLFGV
ncbi:MAG: phosphatidate cytidylyltransferase [Lachnospiraceae bacterium]|nr:phosphatidate cytidylyltransferase [Lachnospiraceae bacterium]